MNLINARTFLENYRSAVAGEEEHKQFTEWLRNASDEDLEAILAESDVEFSHVSPHLLMSGKQAFLDSLTEKINSLDEEDEFPHAPVVKLGGGRKIFRFAAAAVLLFVVGSAVYVGLNNGKAHPGTEQAAGDILPGEKKAVLLLADGRKIVLDDAPEGEIASQGNAQVVKLDNSVLSYNQDNKQTEAKEPVYNTLETPHGIQYKLELPDGSKVWLNALSSIRFPTSFPGKERVVELTGEGYFEVAKDASRPFRVKVNGTDIDVLGTSFNIMAYTDEPALQTTLLEGAVNVKRAMFQTILKPGQQAVITGNAPIAVNANVDVDKVVAWKNGIFSLYRANIYDVMRQVKSWYEIDVKFDGEVKGHITGDIPRNLKLSEVLKILEISGIRSKVENRTVTIMNKDTEK